MASAFAHAFAAASLGAAIVPARRRGRIILLGVICTVLPDIDVGGFALGVPYGDELGHRGLTHSLAFAALTAGVMTVLFVRGAAFAGMHLRVVSYLFLATASHGFFDAMTDGGLGIAFLAPFDPTRWFLPFRPVLVSPIGVGAFFTSRSLEVLASEALWIVLPWSVFCLGLWAIVRPSRGSRVRESAEHAEAPAEDP